MKTLVSTMFHLGILFNIMYIGIDTAFVVLLQQPTGTQKIVCLGIFVYLLLFLIVYIAYMDIKGGIDD